MKSPDEIKRGIITCMEINMEHFIPGATQKSLADALAIIQQLEAQNAELLEEIERLQAERDEAVNDLKELADRHGECLGCKWFTGERCGDTEYKIICGFHDSKWEWRGVQKEERNE